MANQIIEGCGVHHIALNVSDFEKSLKFYTEGLGFTLYRKWGGPEKQIAMVDIGDGNYMEIFSNAKPGVSDCTDAGNYIHLAFRVKDTKAAFARALEYGATEKIAPKFVEIQSDPVLPVWLSFVKGPDGEELEFFQPV